MRPALTRLAEPVRTGSLIFAIMWGIMMPSALAQTGLVVQQLRGIAEAANHDEHQLAVERARRLLDEQPREAEAYYLLGRSLFCLGEVEQAVAAFDKYVELRPERRNRLWERGIALYYAKKYDLAAEQFSLYQTYHDGDVENAVWHYLCRAELDGAQEAAVKMLPVSEDNRVPMAEIYRLFRGEGSIDQVWQAVDRGNPEAQKRAARRFYAELYVALYYHAWHRHDEELRLFDTIESEYKKTEGINRYMWWVARVHLQKHAMNSGGTSP